MTVCKNKCIFTFLTRFIFADFMGIFRRDVLDLELNVMECVKHTLSYEHSFNWEKCFNLILDRPTKLYTFVFKTSNISQWFFSKKCVASNCVLIYSGILVVHANRFEVLAYCMPVLMFNFHLMWLKKSVIRHVKPTIPTRLTPTFIHFHS